MRSVRALTRRRYKHNWRYHKEVHLWLTKESGIEPSQKTDQYERGSYIFFDRASWDLSAGRADDFSGDVGQAEEAVRACLQPGASEERRRQR